MTSDKTRVVLTVVALAVIGIAAVVLSTLAINKMPEAQSQDNTSSQTLTASEITKKVIAKMEYKDLKELDSGNISAHFNLPEGSVTQASVYISISSNSALEVDCFKLSSEDKFESLNYAVAEHIAQKSKGFTENSTDLNLLKNYVIEQYKEYVFVSVSPDADTAVKIFKDIIDGKIK